MIDATTLLPLIEAARKATAAIAKSDAKFQALTQLDRQKRITAYTNRDEASNFDFNNAASLAMDELLKLVPDNAKEHIHEGASDMTKEQMLSKISQLSDEIDANEEENRAMQEQINQLYARTDAMPDVATE